MEPLPQRPQTSPNRQLPPGGNKVQRISGHTKSLVQELKNWVDLRIALARLEIKREIEARKTSIVLAAVMGVFGALGGLFLLFTLAYGLGTLIGYTWVGFLIVTVILFILAGIVYAVRPRMVRKSRNVTIEREEPSGAS